MVSPDNKADNTDGNHRISHSEITKNRLLRECRDDVANNTKGRQNHDVNFRVTKEPEQMLEHLWIAAHCWIEETCTAINTVGEQHKE